MNIESSTFRSLTCEFNKLKLKLRISSQSRRTAGSPALVEWLANDRDDFVAVGVTRKGGCQLVWERARYNQLICWMVGDMSEFVTLGEAH